MVVLFADGFDTGADPGAYVGRSKVEGSFIFVDNLTGGRNGGRRMRVRTARQAANERGLHCPIDAGTDDLWWGCYTMNPDEQNSVQVRWVVFYAGPDAADAVIAFIRDNNGNFEVHVSPDMTATPLVTADFSFSIPSGVNRHLSGHIVRTEDGGYVECFADGVLVGTTDDIPELATLDDYADPVPFTKVLWSARSTQTGSNNNNGFLDDCWVATENLGDAFILLVPPDSDGTYTDGTLEPASPDAAWELVSDVPPDYDRYVGLAGGDKRSFGYDVSNLEAVSAGAIAAIIVEPAIEGVSSIDVFARFAGTDHALGTGEVGVTEVRHAPVQSLANPDTLALWTVADLAAAEFGFEA